MIGKTLFAAKIAFIGLLISPLFILSVASAYQNYSPQEVQKVLKAIAEMKREQFRQDKNTLKKIEITESELNSYIAYRIEVQEEEVMKELHLKLFPQNRIEGMILIDLAKQKIPKFFRRHMTFYFGGKIKVQDEKIKLVIKELWLEGQSIQPKVLDLIIYIASKIEKVEATNINDWYDLPYGIKNIETQKGTAVFYY